MRPGRHGGQRNLEHGIFRTEGPGDTYAKLETAQKGHATRDVAAVDSAFLRPRASTRVRSRLLAIAHRTGILGPQVARVHCAIGCTTQRFLCEALSKVPGTGTVRMQQQENDRSGRWTRRCVANPEPANARSPRAGTRERGWVRQYLNERPKFSKLLRRHHWRGTVVAGGSLG